jgi:hypothetical protein
MDEEIIAATFENMTLKEIKTIIKEYKLATKIEMSKKVNGKRKAFTKKELANELHKHLEIREDGEIVFKARVSGSGRRM